MPTDSTTKILASFTRKFLEESTPETWEKVKYRLLNEIAKREVADDQPRPDHS